MVLVALAPVTCAAAGEGESERHRRGDREGAGVVGGDVLQLLREAYGRCLQVEFAREDLELLEPRERVEVEGAGRGAFRARGGPGVGCGGAG